MDLAARHAAPPGPVRAAATGLARLVWPVACPGCGEPDVPVCPGCAATVVRAGPVLRPAAAAGAPPVRAAAPYAGPARDVLLAWKERGRHDLAPLLAAGLRRAGAAAVAEGLLVGVPDGARPVLVPVPSSRRAVRQRGGDLVEDLARRWVRAAGPGGPGGVAPVLALRAGSGDQVGRGAAARRRARAGALVLRRRPPPVCVLVDDVVTTGATLAAAADALAGGGARVVAAVVVLATPAPRPVGEAARAVHGVVTRRPSP
ncbi:phosphoribosyltransferase family protein [Pseudokineococcus lusitanus]|uniref:Putative amidophosphoribosyltransferase n=1 Tax=Pseudokineococcus lusitanus TaxID=763993 RepID=A0A3N1G936_9ACTN|nr:phosphoribosyltransferase family protein [Pseudokineococcus lusitanus]ROP26760.1 putative amidophosphoribosyltransferase [Pseudokineococcus lusitanus]